MENLVCYIRGGLGDVWPALSAIKPIIEKHNISKFNVTIITDSVYYFRENYPKSFEKFSLEMCHKLSSNVVMVPPWINNNFNLSVFDGLESDKFTQEYADECRNEFMFWRPHSLKEFVRSFINPNTIFIDALFTECIMEWDFVNNKYKRVSSERGVFEFNPPGIEKKEIDKILNENPNHILIHLRKKTGDYGNSPEDVFYNEIIEYCNLDNITPILMGAEKNNIKGMFKDLIGVNPLSFEGMGYLINECKIMLGNDSGFSFLKLYQQQKDKLLIMNHPTWIRREWPLRAIGKPNEKSSYILLDARENNINQIKKYIGDYYGHN